MKNIIVALLAAISIIFGALYINNRIHNNHTVNISDSNNTNVRPSITDEAIHKLEKSLKEKNAEIEKLQQQIAKLKLPAINNISIGQKTEPDNNTAKQNTDNEPDIQNIMEKLIANGMLDQAQAKRAPLSTDEKYAELLDKLGLSDKDQQKFLALLNKKNSMILSDEQKLQIDKNIESLLGDDAYTEYQQYEQIMPTRLFVDDVAVFLSETEYPLTESQVDKMMEINPDLLKNFPLSYSPTSITLANGENGDISSMVDGAVDRTANEFDTVVEESEKILDSNQMNALDQYMDERFKEKEAAADAAATLLPSIINKDFLQKAALNTKTSVTIMQNTSNLKITD